MTFESPQRAGHRWGSGVKDVESRTGDLAVAQRVDESGFVDSPQHLTDLKPLTNHGFRARGRKATGRVSLVNLLVAEKALPAMQQID